MIYKDGNEITRIRKMNVEMYRAYKNGNILFDSTFIGIKNDETKHVLQYGIDNSFLLPSSIYIDKIDNLISELKDNSLFEKFDVLYWMVGDGDLNFKAINIVNPNLSGTPIGGLINELDGIRGNAIDGYIDMNINYRDGTYKYQLDDAHRMAFVAEEYTGTSSRATLDGDLGTVTNSMSNLDSAGQYINSGNVQLSSNADFSGTGMKLLIRKSADDVTWISNNNIVDVISPRVRIEDSSQNVLKRGATAYGSASISVYSGGSSLTDNEGLLLEDIINNNI